MILKIFNNENKLDEVIILWRANTERLMKKILLCNYYSNIV